MSIVSDLNECFAIPAQLVFRESPEGCITAHISNQYAEASIALQGAQVLTWTPADHQSVIWLSDEARYTPGKSMRGGVPVCWPWFGTNEQQPELPAHGFARNVIWDVVESGTLEDGRTQLLFALTQTNNLCNSWPFQVSLKYRITVGEELELELATKNSEPSTIVITEALHTYLNIADITNISIHGLEDTEFLDKVDNGQRKIQSGPITFTAEVDRIYLGTRAECVIEDPENSRKIHISKEGSESTVVWNPWINKARKLGDLGEDGYCRMVCVETANAAEDAVTVAPGETHLMRASYRVEKLGNE